MVTREAKQGPEISLAGLVDKSIARFRSRRLDNSGFNVYHLDSAVIDTMNVSGLTPETIHAVVETQSSLDPDLRAVVAKESAEFDPKNVQLVTAGRLIVEEIKLKHPDVHAENEKRIKDFPKARI